MAAKKDEGEGGADLKVRHSQVLVTRQIKRTKKAPVGDKPIKETTSETEEDLISVHQFVTEPAMVGISYGRTINLGDFESLRVDVTVRIPCYKEEVPAAFERVKTFAAERIRSEIDRMSRDRNNPF